MGHALTENRHGLVVDVETTQANGTAEWDAAERMIRRSVKRSATVRADKGYALNPRRRKMVEEAFGWIKAVGDLRKSRHIGLAKLAGQVPIVFAAYNLTRLLSLMQPKAQPTRARFA